MADGTHSSSLLGRVSAIFKRFKREKAANVAVIFALAMVPTIGVIGLGVEGSVWLMGKRAAQNAADGAVLAAAQADQANIAVTDAGGTGCSNCYVEEGKGVANRHGFTDGAANTAVAVNNNLTCPHALDPRLPNSLTCYKVTIIRPMELLFTRLVGGFQGDTQFTFNRTVAGPGGNTTVPVTTRGQNIKAIAWAGPVPVMIPVCILALKQGGGKKGDSITLHGNPRANLGDCTIFSDAGATCTGHNSGAWVGGAVGTDNNCGIAEFSNQAVVLDPYASLGSKILANQCTKYQQESPTNQSGNSTGVTTIPGGNYTASQLVSAISGAAGTGFAYTPADPNGDGYYYA
jgi:Flp pilus assembly protein TadG